MKIKATVDREYTEKWMVERVKEDIAEFTECYTPEFILQEFLGAMEEAGRGDELGVQDCGSITQCTAKAFPGGTNYDNETHYSVEMTTEGWNDGHEEVTKYRFYIDQSGNIPNLILWNQFTKEFDKMYSVKRFICKG